MSRTRISSRKFAKHSATSDGAGSWHQFSLTVRPEDSAPATALLETATGALAAIESVAGRSTAGRSICRRTRITVHVPRANAAKAQVRLAKMLAAARKKTALAVVQLEVEELRDEAWASSWKRYYKPFQVAPQLYIAPSWERTFQRPCGSKVLWMDPGMAFGTGQHPTTQLALGLLLGHVHKGAIVLDIGCGSGVLVLAAAQRGAHVYASDMDSIAMHATRDNFAANKLKAAKILRARGVPASFPRAHIITANITARVLVNLARPLACKLLPGGVLIASGVTESGRAEVIDAFRRAGLDLVEERSSGPWHAHLHRKRASR